MSMGNAREENAKKTLADGIVALLVDYMMDGFNRSLNALWEAGAVNTRKMDRENKGNDTSG